MYQVVCILDEKEHILMDMRDEDYTIDSPKLTLQLNGAGSFEFKILPTHPEIDSIRPLVSLIKVYKTNNGTDRKWMFTGRVMSDERDIYNTGKVKCEGILAYLIDSIVYPYEYQGTPADYVRQLILSHNSQVNTSKQFIIRTIDLADADSNNNIVRANKNYPTTFRELRDKVIKLLNAYISAEERDGNLYFDCYQTVTHYNSQPIRLGENIIDLKQTKSVDKIRTVMIGIGDEDDDGNRIRATVENQEAIAKYGRIVGTVDFKNVSTMEQLSKKTEAYLDSILAEINTVEVKAIDLNMTDADIEEITLGYAYVESQYNGLNHYRMLISKIEIYLMQPDKNTFTLGADKKSMTSSMSRANADIDDGIQQISKTTSSQIESKVSNATQLITGVKGGYVILDCGDDVKDAPTQILIMDAPDKETAKNVIRINKNGIGFSTGGYNGPYRNAWTIDGNLVADFITAGTMYADRIKGGTLTLGGLDNKSGVAKIEDKEGNTLLILDNNGITLDSSVKIAWGNISGTENVAKSSDIPSKTSQLTNDSNLAYKGDIPSKTSQLTNDSGLAYKNEIPSDKHITQITKDTITTTYINALKIVAGSVAAENITGTEIKGKKISGSTFYQTSGNAYLNIVGGEMRGGMNGKETGYISFASTVDGKPSLDFRASKLNFCMDAVYVGNGKDTTSVTQAYTGDIKYNWGDGTAVMKFRNGLLLKNG